MAFLRNYGLLLCACRGPGPPPRAGATRRRRRARSRRGRFHEQRLPRVPPPRRRRRPCTRREELPREDAQLLLARLRDHAPHPPRGHHLRLVRVAADARSASEAPLLLPTPSRAPCSRPSRPWCSAGTTRRRTSPSRCVAVVPRAPPPRAGAPRTPRGRGASGKLGSRDDDRSRAT